MITEKTDLYTQFIQALQWNALLYLIYRIIHTGENIALYSILPTSAFATWTTINSLVFLAALWTDLGLRKSIARFWPILSHNSIKAHTFLSILILTQGAIIILSLPGYTYMLMYILPKVQPKLIIISAMLYIMQTLNTLTQHIYHAYFLNKLYNTTISIFVCIEIIANCILLYILPPSISVVIGMLIIKLISKCILFIYTFLSIKHTVSYPMMHSHTIKEPFPVKSFITYSVFTWSTSILKSLTERNFLAPLIIAIAGPTTGSLFKITNETALFFYRFIIKTLGTADTTYLSYAHNEINIPFKRLEQTTLLLGTSVMICIVFILIVSNTLYVPPKFIVPFGIMAMSYILETLFIPYERYLEVHQCYKNLLWCYIPYISIALATYISYFYNSYNLILFISLIHISRLTSLLSMKYVQYHHIKNTHNNTC